MKALKITAPIGGRVQGYLSRHPQIPTLKEFRTWLRDEHKAWASERLLENPKGWMPSDSQIEELKKDLKEAFSKRPRKIGLFYPNPKWDEVSPEFFKRLEEFLVSQKIESGFPRINAKGKMEFATCSLKDCIPQGQFGIYSSPPQAAVCNPQVFLVPASLADSQGNRLGRGRGHFDSYFSSHFNNALDTHLREFWCCAVIHSDSVVVEIPQNWIQPHDVKMNSILANNFYLRSQELC